MSTNETQMQVSLMNAADTLMSNYENGTAAKAVKPVAKIFVAAIMAGMFIAFGGSSSNVAVFGIENVGLARTLAGCIFPVGLMLIVLVGGELFTGNCMMIGGVMTGRIKAMQMIRVLVTVYLGNLVGSLIVSFLAYYSGQWKYGAGALGAYTIKVAFGKLNLSFGTAVASGILCNILVCVAALMASASKDAVGKIFGCFFPIWAFVIAGYEHCVANMYYIPAGIIAAMDPAFAQKAMELYGYTAEDLAMLNPVNMIVNNLIPVTIGSIIGGMLFVAVPYVYLYNKKAK